MAKFCVMKRPLPNPLVTLFEFLTVLWLLVPIRASTHLLPKRCGHRQVDFKPKRQYDEPGPNSYLYYGDTAIIKEFPWVAAIANVAHGDAPQITCAGSLLADRWIVTSGHCV